MIILPGVFLVPAALATFAGIGGVERHPTIPVLMLASLLFAIALFCLMMAALFVKEIRDFER